MNNEMITLAVLGFTLACLCLMAWGIKIGHDVSQHNPKAGGWVCVMSLVIGLCGVSMLWAIPDEEPQSTAQANYHGHNIPTHLQYLEIHLERWMDSVGYPDQCRAELHEVVIIGEDVDATGECAALTESAADRFVMAMNQPPMEG